MNVSKRVEDKASEPFPLTQDIASWVASFQASDATPRAMARAKHALLDWFGVTIAGASEPLVEILVDELTEGANGPCTIVGYQASTNALNAALINGATSHALDYDDVNRRLHGHPTVTVAAAALALGEQLGSSGKDVVTAFIAGTEVACALGEFVGDDHYEQGFHATGTMGTFGAAAACAHLMGLDATRTAHALGIAASQASGLKANFGTMTKPFHAGKAAMNGLLAARIAARGFTANPHAIEAGQGFGEAMAPGYRGAPIRPDPSAPFEVEKNLFKYHAACYLTHASLEAIKDMKAKHGVKADDVEEMVLRVRPSHFTVCNIQEPKTGLEIKFGIRHLTGLGLTGLDTGALETYSDENALDAGHVAMRNRVKVQGDNDLDRNAAVVTMKLKDGRTLEGTGDVGTPAKDDDAQWKKLSDKFLALTVPVIGRERGEKMQAMVAALDNAEDVRSLMAAAR